MKNLSTLFDAVWKVCLLATLIWMGQSLREIADASYVDDGTDATEPTSQQMPTGTGDVGPESIPLRSAMPMATRT